MQRMCIRNFSLKRGFKDRLIALENVLRWKAPTGITEIQKVGIIKIPQGQGQLRNCFTR